MSSEYAHIQDLAATIEIPSEGILTKTHFEDDLVKVILFGFSKGQELSEHTSSKPAMLYFARGQGLLRLGGDEHSIAPGTWTYMPPHLPHTIKAETDLAMLLVLMKSKA
ncbi:MAG: cupin domain-containing protein [Planctomycetes bacterium]|nr:cupin domain-containing protein [Planctomycetota bacterium]